MAHSQMDLVLQCLDAEALDDLHTELEARVFTGDAKGYERERLVQQYLAVVVEREIRRIGDAYQPER